MNTLLFDFWGTVAYLEEGRDFVAEIVYSLGITKVEYREFIIKTWYKENLTPEEFSVRLTTHFGKEPDINIVDLLFSPFERVKLYADVIPNLNRLSKNNELFLVSDTTNIGKKCAILTEMEMYFGKIFFSCDYGITKREGLYEVVIGELACRPSECIVLGNSINSDYLMAERIGAQAILVDRKNEHKGFRKIITLDELK